MVLVIGSLGVGLGVTLWLSTDAAERSYELGHARETNQALLQQKEALERQVLEAQAAPALAEAARNLGMIPTRDTAHLVQDASGNWVVVGTPKPAQGVAAAAAEHASCPRKRRRLLPAPPPAPSCRGAARASPVRVPPLGSAGTHSAAGRRARGAGDAGTTAGRLPDPDAEVPARRRGDKPPRWARRMYPAPPAGYPRSSPGRAAPRRFPAHAGSRARAATTPGPRVSRGDGRKAEGGGSRHNPPRSARRGRGGPASRWPKVVCAVRPSSSGTGQATPSSSWCCWLPPRQLFNLQVPRAAGCAPRRRVSSRSPMSRRRCAAASSTATTTSSRSPSRPGR